MKTEKIWFNGKFLDWEKANVHVLTHGLHYGSGVFEGIRAYKTDKGPAVFKLKEHVDRFFSSAEALQMKIPFSKDEISEAIKNTVKENGLQDCYIRPIAFYGEGKMGLNPSGAPINVVIAAWPWPAYIGETAKVCTSDLIRIHPKSLKANKKICGHYVNSIMASQEAKEKGFDEALLLDWEGYVAEGPGENIFMIKEGKIISPPKSEKILPGITRDSIIEIAKELGYSVSEEEIRPEELSSADELFFTGTAAEVISIIQLDEKTFPKGDITQELRNRFIEIIHGRNPRHEDWLNYVE